MTTTLLDLSSSNSPQQTVTGVVSRIVWPRDPDKLSETGYRIFILESGGEEFSIKGEAPGVAKGTTVSCDGVWKNDNRYGKYLQTVYVRETMPSDLDGIKDYLAKAKIPGMGRKTAERIVDHFGIEVFDVLDRFPERLSQVPTVKGKTAEKILAGWDEKRGPHTVMLFLREHKIQPAMAHKVYKFLGGEGISAHVVIDRIKKNPYLISDIKGIGFKSADAMAQSLGVAKDDPFRVMAGTVHHLREESGNGHTMRPWGDAIGKIAELLEIDRDRVAEVVERDSAAHRSVELIIRDEGPHLALRHLSNAERTIAQETERIQAFAHPIAHPNAAILAGPFTIREGTITLVAEQEQAVRASCTAPISIVTGRPGTGKTSIMRAIIEICDRLGKSVQCCAPTGLAAVRLRDATGLPASTIHRLLGLGLDRKKQSGPPEEEDAPEKINADVLIVDETSMIGTTLMAELLKAIPNGCAVILVGDVDQLPSVEAGNVLYDLISSGRYATTRLMRIHRQKAGATGKGQGIVEGAHAVIDGILPPFNDADFRFIPQSDNEKAAEWIVGIVRKMNEQGTEFKDIQVLTPMKKGSLGTENLNKLLQAAINPPAPGKKQVEFRGSIFRVGDKVLQLKNDYKMGADDDDYGYGEQSGGVVNGDIGFILDIDLERSKMLVSFAGERDYWIDKEKWENLTGAAAMTIHKSQGSEFRRVIMPISNAHYIMLNRNLYYTGITRAKEQCVLVGENRALQIAVATKSNSVRCTGLQDYLKLPEAA